MRRRLNGLVGVAVVGLLLHAAAGPGNDRFDKGPRTGDSVFSALSVGQHVALKEVGSHFEVRSFDSEAAPHTVVEIGPDFLVVRDLAGVADTRIPVFSVRAVVHARRSR